MRASSYFFIAFSLGIAQTGNCQEEASAINGSALLTVVESFSPYERINCQASIPDSMPYDLEGQLMDWVEVEEEANLLFEQSVKGIISSNPPPKPIPERSPINTSPDNLPQPYVEPSPDAYQIGKIYPMEDILYGYDSSRLRPESKRSLDKIIALFWKYPDMRLTVMSHTDTRGERFYNYQLSEERAKSVIDYMASKGVAREQLRAIGFGENMPIVACKDTSSCTDLDHEINRRTEFQIDSYGYGVSIPEFNNTSLSLKH